MSKNNFSNPRIAELFTPKAATKTEGKPVSLLSPQFPLGSQTPIKPNSKSLFPRDDPFLGPTIERLYGDTKAADVKQRQEAYDKLMNTTPKGGRRHRKSRKSKRTRKTRKSKRTRK